MAVIAVLGGLCALAVIALAFVVGRLSAQVRQLTDGLSALASAPPPPVAAVGLTATVAAIAVPMLLVVAALAAGGIWWLRKRSRGRCATSRVVDLASPVARSSQDLA